MKRKDMLSTGCIECGKGNYRETGLLDDLKGVLHCELCDHEVSRYVLIEEPLQTPNEIL